MQPGGECARKVGNRISSVVIADCLLRDMTHGRLYDRDEGENRPVASAPACDWIDGRIWCHLGLWTSQDVMSRSSIS